MSTCCQLKLAVSRVPRCVRQAPAPAPKVALAKPPAKPAAKVAAAKVMPAVAVEMVDLEDSRRPGDSWTKYRRLRWLKWFKAIANWSGVDITMIYH